MWKWSKEEQQPLQSFPAAAAGLEWAAEVVSSAPEEEEVEEGEEEEALVASNGFSLDYCALDIYAELDIPSCWSTFRIWWVINITFRVFIYKN